MEYLNKINQNLELRYGKDYREMFIGSCMLNNVSIDEERQQSDFSRIYFAVKSPFYLLPFFITKKLIRGFKRTE